MADGYGPGRAMRCMMAGAAAARAGQDSNECPYAPSSGDFHERQDSRYWIKGYVRARRMIERRKRLTAAKT